MEQVGPGTQCILVARSPMRGHPNRRGCEPENSLLWQAGPDTLLRPQKGHNHSQPPSPARSVGCATPPPDSSSRAVQAGVTEWLAGQSGSGCRAGLLRGSLCEGPKLLFQVCTFSEPILEGTSLGLAPGGRKSRGRQP